MPERLITPEISAREARLAYNPRLDVEAFRALTVLKDTYPPEVYKQEQDNLLALTKTNVITSLAERLNVEIYKTTYTQKDGKLYHSQFYPDKPFLEVVQTGQQTRQKAGSTEVKRELAEVEGFTKVQSILDSGTDTNTKVIVISPKGDGNSIYGHNFFDVYQRGEAGEITMSRFTSKATKQEFQSVTYQLAPTSEIPPNPTDADFLANPITTTQNINDIQTLLNQDERTISHEDFLDYIETITPQIEIYLANLAGGTNLNTAENQYKTILKSIDIASGQDDQFSQTAREQIIARMQTDTVGVSRFLAMQPLRVVKTGCGISGGTLSNPFSVAEFSASTNFKSEDTSDFRCPGRKENGEPCTYIVKYGSGITTCPECGEKAKCV